ncbi:MAG: cation transporter [Kiritimatiellia bacterium]|nr:cation transporter [Lentisphaeria bacterium]
MNKDIVYQQEKSVLVILVLAILWCVPNLLLAVKSGSLVLSSDIPDNFRFIITNILSWRVLRSIRQERLHGYDYGTDKLQVFAGVVCSATYIMSLILIAGFALIRMVKPATMDQSFTSVGAFFQFVVFLVMGWFWQKNKRLACKQHSPVMETQWRLNRADALSALVCCASLMVWLLLKERPWAIYLDPIFALLFVCFAIVSFTPKLVAEVNELLDRTLQDELQLKIDRRLAEHFHGYEDFHGVRSRRAGKRIFIEVALSFAPEQQVSEVSRTVASLRDGIQSDVPGSEARIVFVPCAKDASPTEGSTLYDG